MKNKLVRSSCRLLLPFFLFISVAYSDNGISNGISSPVAVAVDTDQNALQRSIDTAWVIVAGLLVFFMQAGFGMLETGFTRAKNAANILMKNFMNFAMASIAYWAVGFGLMFGKSAQGLVGTSVFFINGDINHLHLSIPKLAYWFFQVMFAAAAATIVAGPMAERTKFAAYLTYSFLISALVYPISGHWIWGNGWLSQMGFKDFAGSTVVHSVGGWASLMGAIILGPRLGKYRKDGTISPLPGHNIPLAALGVLILWFGWFGFNLGNSLGVTGSKIELVSLIAVNTTLSASAGAIMSMSAVWLKYGKPDPSLALNGALAGLVSISAPCAYISNFNAVIVGAISGLIATFGVELLDRLKIDDPVGAIPVHAFNGVWGSLAVGLFASNGGLFTTGELYQFGVQFLGVVVVLVWVVVSTGLLFLLLKNTIGLRVSPEEELQGLDLSEHQTESYPDFQITILPR